MTIATGPFLTIAYKPEVAYGTVPAASGAQQITRASFTASVEKQTFESAEIRPDQQVADFRHGVRSVKAQLKAELAPKAQADFFAAILARDFTAGVSATGLSITIAAGAVVGGVQSYTITRGSGSYLTDGFKIGDICRLTAGGFATGNLNLNVQVIAVTSATVLQVIPVNRLLLMTAEGPISSATIAVFGKKTYAPSTGHTNKSFSFEDWYSDISQSEVYAGLKFSKASLNMQPKGIADVTFDLSGQKLADPTAGDYTGSRTTQFFTTPTAPPTYAKLAAVNGSVCVGDVPVALITGLTLDVERPMSGDPVVGSFYVPQQNPGIIKVTGSATLYFSDATVRDLFINETESDLYLVMTCDNTKNSDFLNIVLPRVKFNGATKNDGVGGYVQTVPFQALYNVGAGTGTSEELTTVSIQDSQA